MAGRPRTAIGTYGQITVRRRGGRAIAETRVRDADGRLRQVRVHAGTAERARAELKQRLLNRLGHHGDGVLRPDSSFTELADLWLSDLASRDIAPTTKNGYRDTLRLHVRPAMEHYTLGEITTGRVERFFTAQRAVSDSQARRTRTVLNLLFSYALRHDAISRNPVEGTSQMTRPKGSPKALTMAQIAAIRVAAATWRAEPGLPGPKPDGQVRDIIEVLLGTGMRPGEVLALRPCDVSDGPTGMVAHVTGTVVHVKGKGTYRQPHPKTHASIRSVAVPTFAEAVLRRRLATIAASRGAVGSDDPKNQNDHTIFANRSGGPLAPYNVRRTFREFLSLAGLAETGVSLRWYRRTAATVIARGMGTDAAATFLGHTSTTITEDHYIEPTLAIDRTPARHLELTLRPENPDETLLAAQPTDEEEAALDELDEPDSDAAA